MTVTTHLQRTKRSLSPARRRLVELMQSINYGSIANLEVRNGEPVFDPPPHSARDIYFNKGANSPHPRLERDDFALKSQILELFALFDREGALTIEILFVQDGLPFRLTVADVARAA